MSFARHRTAIVILVAALVGGGTGLVLGLVDDSDPTEPTPPASVPTEAASPQETPGDDRGGGNRGSEADDDPSLPPPEADPEGLAPGPSGPAPSTEDERAAAAAATGYIEAIDTRDGGATCRAFAAGALDGFDFPGGSGGCANQARASFGFDGKGGQPVWRSSRTTKALSAQVDGDTARVVATIFTTYEDVREPTIEDDIMYLVRSGNSWKLAKPSLTLYRAIGDSDVPPSALAPPG